MNVNDPMTVAIGCLAFVVLWGLAGLLVVVFMQGGTRGAQAFPPPHSDSEIGSENGTGVLLRMLEDAGSLRGDSTERREGSLRALPPEALLITPTGTLMLEGVAVGRMR